MTVPALLAQVDVSDGTASGQGAGGGDWANVSMSSAFGSHMGTGSGRAGAGAIV